jgi:S1-C subfamily serine protease
MKLFPFARKNNLQENTNILDKSSLEQSTGKASVDRNNRRNRLRHWRWLCIHLFIPSIFFIQILKEIPNRSKFVLSTDNSIMLPTKVGGRIDNGKKNYMIQTRISESDIKSKAEKISVKIALSKGASASNGSGLIFKKIVQPSENKTRKYKYYILTNNHVLTKNLQDSLSLKILTSDKKEHVGKLSEPIQSLKRYDLQLISFESNQEYEIAIIAKPTQISQWDRAYIFGYPCDDKSCNSRKFVTGNIGMMNLLPNSIKLTKGYSVPYTNETESGMSGSPVLNSRAEVIAIHGLGKNAEPDISLPNDSPYLLSNEALLSPEKKEIAKLFSWGIDLVIISEELSRNLI